MKKNYLMTLVMLIMSCAFISSQTFNEHDKENVRALLRQESRYINYLNLQLLGLEISDTLDWKNSETWIEKTSKHFEWKDGYLVNVKLNGQAVGGDISFPNSQFLESIKGSGRVYDNLGNPYKTINASNCPQLQCIEFEATDIYDINISGSTKLKILNLGWCKIKGELDLSTMSELEELYVQDNNLTSIKLPNPSKLKVFWCSDNLLEELDVSHSTELTYLHCYNNKISSLNTSQLHKIQNLVCSENNITHLDVLHLSELESLLCSRNKLTTLEVKDLLKLQTLYCDNNEISNLNISNLPSLTALYCFNNNLTFSKLPPINTASRWYLYSPLNIIDGGKVAYDKEIDLSSEYNINGNITSYKWYDELGNNIVLTQKNNGQFIAGEKYNGQTLTCKMTNIAFPGNSTPVGQPEKFIPLVLEYKVTITPSESIILKDHLKLNTDNNHLINKDQIFQIYASTTLSNADALQFGLYNPINGTLRDSLIISSRKNNIYTCHLRSNTSEGSYMLMPYINIEGKTIPVERSVTSPYIDKLPIKIENNIWGRAVSYTPSETVTATKYMQLNINSKVNQIFKTNQFEEFMVNIPTSTPTSARVGLFYSNGDFCTDITTAQNSSTYKCLINDNVLEGNYILMPYVSEDGIIKAIERTEGNLIMDRLPLYVVAEDIWGEWDLRKAEVADIESTGNAASQISAYPNPVTDILYLKGVDGIAEIAIYTLSGSLVKKTTIDSPEELSVRFLPAGVYAVKITTAKGKKVTMKVQKQ